MRFYLGTHMPDWLADPRMAEVPLFINRRRLEERYVRKALPVARGPWALDSGGFSEITMFGQWRIEAQEYVRQVRRYMQEIGNLQWAAPQDWMCEVKALMRSGVNEALPHILRSVDNWAALKDLAPDLPIIPVLQGGTRDTFLRSLEEYDHRGFELSKEPIVGLGSVCRQKATSGVYDAIFELAAKHGLRMHAFGFKKTGVRKAGGMLASTDSLAWSKQAVYYEPSTPEERRLHGHSGSCANCALYALAWRDSLLERADGQGPDPCVAEVQKDWREQTPSERRFRGVMARWATVLDQESAAQRTYDSLLSLAAESSGDLLFWYEKSLLPEMLDDQRRRARLEELAPISQMEAAVETLERGEEPAGLSGKALAAARIEARRRATQRSKLEDQKRSSLEAEIQSVAVDFGAEMLKAEGVLRPAGGGEPLRAWKELAEQRGRYLVERWQAGDPVGVKGVKEIAARDRAAICLSWNGR